METEGNYPETYHDYMRMPWHVFLHRASHLRKRTDRIRNATKIAAKGKTLR